ncbi:hypothetical protein SDRG_01618 [Saprolegnia diclina VS20]|uniref:Uncharacterized protein n=1 Tax=Saprolegnia diclina (strain VS20) TaxID=1156394 RepID=T0R5I3_SAPDV|nr:hypothetical protein SDRG_01618 [Saprolegnia diclina VS20]EQC41660.1 hypothetical protein SDRG_01618 [Saprolegnia diclina VS20]|eukprot:XP_008605374.1 hypothetical protein SDRG_01618 [Saprolegnia diclina VS20]
MAADFDPYTKQWMREAMMSRDIIGDLEAVNAKLRADLERKSFQLDLMDACVSQIGATEKLQSAIDARLHPPKDAYRISPQRLSPRKKDGRSDELIFGGESNKFAHGSEALQNMIEAHTPRKGHPISQPYEPPREPISPRKIKHDAQLFGGASPENKFAFGSPRHNDYVEHHHAVRTNEITECPKHEQGYVCGSDAYQKTAAYDSSYMGQTARTEHARSWTFEREEAALRQSKDIFGNEKKKLLLPGRPTHTYDCIDQLVQSTDRRSPRRSGNNPH